MKKYLFVLLTLLLLFALPSVTLAAVNDQNYGSEIELLSDEEAETEKLPFYGDLVQSWNASSSGNVTASLYVSASGGYTLVVSGEGSMKNYTDYSEVPWFYACVSSVDTVVIESGVTSIGDYAFYGHGMLKNVSVASSVKSVGAYSFAGAKSLEKITLPDTVATIDYGAFYRCKSLKDISIPAVTTIYDAAFETCSSLESIVLPGTLKNLAVSAFFDCTSLTDIEVEEENTAFSSIDGNLYSKDKTTLFLYANGKTDEHFAVPDGVLNIGDYAFYRTSLGSIEFTPDLKGIGENAFYGSTALSSVYLPPSLETVGRWAFAECSNLTEVDLGAVKKIGAYAFYGDSLIEQICLPDTAFEIGTGAFADCIALANIDFSAVQTIGDYAFWGCNSLEALVIPESVTLVGINAFMDCDSLKSVRIDSKAVAETDCGGVIEYAEKLYIPASFTQTDLLKSSFSNVFPIVNGTVYYLYSNCAHAWTKLESSYFCPECSESRPPLDITFVNVTAGYDLSVNVYTDMAYDATVCFTMNGKTVAATAVYEESLGLYRFTFEGVTPQCMGDIINAELVYDGIAVDALSDYSIRKYCDELLASSADKLGMSEEKYSKLCTLVRDLLHYGAAAQAYTRYNADAPVDNGIFGGSVFEELTETDFAVTQSLRQGELEFYATNLRFENTNKLYFKFTSNDVSRVTLKLSVKGITAIYTAEDFDLQNEVYSFLTDDIYPSDFAAVYTAVLLLDGEEVQTLTYSVRSYVYDKQNSENEVLSNLVKTLYNYGASAKNYV